MELSRRAMLGGLAAGLATVRGLATAAPPKAGDPPTTGRMALSAYQYEANTWVKLDGDTVACYRSDTHQKYPYLYPFIGPAGLPMTDESSQPWPHHRSIFFGCDRVNGGNYWQEGLDRGQIVSTGVKVTDEGPQRVELADTCEWRDPARRVIMVDQRRISFAVPDKTLRVIDVHITLSARTDISISRTNHSLFSIRAARALSPAGGGTLVNSEGAAGEAATYGVPARWCAFSGTRAAGPESIVLMDHPDNPWAPCKWFTRDYGFASPTPFEWLDEKGWALAVGQSVRLSYRVVAMTGAPTRARVEPLFAQFAADRTSAGPATQPSR